MGSSISARFIAQTNKPRVLQKSVIHSGFFPFQSRLGGENEEYRVLFAGLVHFMPFPMGQNVALCSLPKDVKLEAAALCINRSSRIKFTCSRVFCTKCMYVCCLPILDLENFRSLIYCSSSKAGTRLLLKPISSVGSGLEASITDKKDNAISIKDFEIVVESKGDDKMQPRNSGCKSIKQTCLDMSPLNNVVTDVHITVEVSGFKTQEIYDEVFSKMVDDAQPIPGFRRVKGDTKRHSFGNLGPSKVYEQVIRKIINSGIAESVAKEGLTVGKDLQIEQSLEDLEASFEPGSNFKFDATVQCLNKS
ncbi:hypothetical protein Sango_2398200 [Sesamum angolense]|uniref:peptidylprolyl isomerase n=1 Tax=Sesamum angolense TaxID=2727404 RepID=A0AAE1W710_9LAMI|nr:hypothetical protein Sango_2398200 [Sesamum angolense]